MTLFFKDLDHKISITFYFSFIFLLNIVPNTGFSENNAVRISKDILEVTITYNKKPVTIKRIQDQNHRLTNDFTKTSRPCPPFCINPIQIAEGVKTLGELELLNFIKNDIQNGSGLLVDARLPIWYEKSTIPGSINIPFKILNAKKVSPYTLKILKLLGATDKKMETQQAIDTKQKKPRLNFDNVKKLALFCNGSWCGQSGQAINNLIALGYPAEKLFWYRGGMQAWQILGLTTISP